MRRTGKRGVDVVFEHVGGDVWEKSIRSLTRGGRLVTTGGTEAYDVKMNVLAYVFQKELRLLGANSTTKPELEAQMPLRARGRDAPGGRPRLPAASRRRCPPAPGGAQAVRQGRPPRGALRRAGAASNRTPKGASPRRRVGGRAGRPAAWGAGAYRGFSSIWKPSGSRM